MRRGLAPLLLLAATLPFAFGAGCQSAPARLLFAPADGASEVRWVLADSALAVSFFGRSVSVFEARKGRMLWTSRAVAREVWHPTFGIATSATGETLAVATPDGVLALLARTGRRLLATPGGGATLALSSDGRWLAWGDGRNGRIVSVPDTTTTRELRVPGEHGGLVWLDRVRSFAWTDGPRVMFHAPDSNTTRSLGPFTEGAPGSLAATRLGATLAVAESTNAISVWNTGTGTQRSRMRLEAPRPARHMALSSDGWFLATADGGTVRVRWAYTGREVFTWRPHRGADVRDLAFSTQGHRMATLGAEGMLAVWDLSPATRNAPGDR
jgi:WD40 repeat protein